ncbi:MAG: NAD-glutamate dehydrogenase [Acetobacteraceae bacterium]|nr:NAD-glutamate dehydrogenase [Acetobacteraceae bacterium]
MKPEAGAAQALLEKTVAAVTEAGPRADPQFVQLLFRNVPPEDLLGRRAEDLACAADSLWSFIAVRRPGRAAVRVVCGEGEPDCWAEGRSVVQIVNDDMPFLVDSVTQALNARHLVVHLVIHPVTPVERDGTGRLRRFGAQAPGAPAESFMHIELDGSVEQALVPELVGALEAVLAEVRIAVVDHPLMQAKAASVAQESAHAPVPVKDATEAAAFLAWLTDRNFTFLGYRDYRIEQDNLLIEPHSGLGLLRDDGYLVFDGLRSQSQLPALLSRYRQSPGMLTVSKSSQLSGVHRRAPMDTVAVKRFDAEDRVAGLRLFIGLFTSQSYSRPLETVPLLRSKLSNVMERAGFAPDSHDGKALRHIIDSLPRDELFQFDDDALFDTAIGILGLQDRQRVALFLRHDAYGRFVSALVYVPKDRYSAAVRDEMAAVLTGALGGALASEATHLDDSALARLHFVIVAPPNGAWPEIDRAALEARLIEVGRSWADRLGDALLRAHGHGAAERLLGRYRSAFAAGYAERTDAARAIGDIGLLEKLRAGAAIAIRMQPGTAEGGLSLRTAHRGEPLALSDVLPVLENFGLRVISELPFSVRPADAAETCWIQDFELLLAGAEPLAAETAARFEDAFASVWSGAFENDGFNRLVFLAGLSSRQVLVLRLYCKILRQAGFAFSQRYMEDTLAAHPAIAGMLVRYFEAAFDPARPEADRDGRTGAVAAEIEAALEGVANLDEDRILRGYTLLMAKTLRTNHYRAEADGQPKDYVSVKLASRDIELLPLPRPLVEIYVYSPRIEGCHLRGGKVARGGLRWSDRKEDFRTEVLGLMKAQMVKNAVIVPVGSKGGFVVKRPPPKATREALMAEVIACYKTFIGGLLDITDNLGGDTVVPPPNVVRRDPDDPYLVVAADKGTATFSDLANGVAHDYGFWLDDAFASGGSVGYDHKVMGITSRGAWEAVKRHFREMNRDIQADDFTCVGVGDMSGDVFGNGMLLSKHTRLVGAFNHQHIFIDPDPDPARSWTERKRLFDLPRSGWADYDTSLLSAGGAIYERSAKSLALSPQAQALLGLDRAAVAPNELIGALLRADVDLLWFGGIGTYVKARTETQAEAGDRANDALRIDGADLRARVVGEGANLAVTQRARIEYALRGGRINTDAIDNSAGVDTSDHEVNIKIGVGQLIESGHVAAADRPAFLAAMTDEVATLVLRNNELQTLAISVAEAEAPAQLDQHTRLMRSLEREGRLDRAVEFLPNAEALGQRAAAGRGLMRPELAVLLAYAKMALYDDLLDSDLPGDSALGRELLAYFPQVMRETAPDILQRHRLRRDIVGTIVANTVINRMGPAFVAEMEARTGRSATDIARAWLIVREAFNLAPLWGDIDALDRQLAAPTQIALLLALRHAAEGACRWLLQTTGSLAIGERAEALKPGIATLGASLDAILPPAERDDFAARRNALAELGAEPGLAERVAATETLASALDVLAMSGPGTDLGDVARVYFGAGDRLGLLELRRLASRLPSTTPWQRMANAALADDLAAIQRDIAGRILRDGAGEPDALLARWLEGRQDTIRKVEELRSDMRRAQTVDLAMLIVAARQLRTLASV